MKRRLLLLCFVNNISYCFCFPLQKQFKTSISYIFILSKICLSTCWFQHFIKNKKAWSETLKNPSSQLFPPFLYGLFPHRNRGTLKTWFLFTLLNHTIKWRRSWLCSILSRQVISKWLRYCFKLSKHFGNFSLSISGIYFIDLQSLTF